MHLQVTPRRYPRGLRNRTHRGSVRNDANAGSLLTRAGRQWLRTEAWTALSAEQRRLTRTHRRLIASLRPLIRARSAHRPGGRHFSRGAAAADDSGVATARKLARVIHAMLRTTQGWQLTPRQPQAAAPRPRSDANGLRMLRILVEPQLVNRPARAHSHEEGGLRPLANQRFIGAFSAFSAVTALFKYCEKFSPLFYREPELALSCLSTAPNCAISEPYCAQFPARCASIARS